MTSFWPFSSNAVVWSVFWQRYLFWTIRIGYGTARQLSTVNVCLYHFTIDISVFYISMDFAQGWRQKILEKIGKFFRFPENLTKVESLYNCLIFLIKWIHEIFFQIKLMKTSYWFFVTGKFFLNHPKIKIWTRNFCQHDTLWNLGFISSFKKLHFLFKFITRLIKETMM